MQEISEATLSLLGEVDFELKDASAFRVGSPNPLNLMRNTVDQWQALAVLRLAFPKLVRYGELVLLEDNFEADSVAKFIAQGVQGVELERVINHVHLWDVLKHSEVPGSAHSAISNLITFSWCIWIPRCTGRSAIVDWSDGPESYGPTLTFTTVAGSAPAVSEQGGGAFVDCRAVPISSSSL